MDTENDTQQEVDEAAVTNLTLSVEKANCGSYSSSLLRTHDLGNA